jgi:hypothetical protein
MYINGIAWALLGSVFLPSPEMFCVFMFVHLLISADKDRAAVIKGSDSQREAFGPGMLLQPIVRVIH